MGCFRRTASKHVYYLGWNRSPAQVGCMRQALRPGALGRPRGIGWRGRWEWGSGWGTHVNPWLFHFNVWQNSLQKKKKTIVTEWLQPHNSWNNKTLERKTHWDINSDYICITGLHGFLFFSSYLYCPDFLEYIQLRTELCPSNSHVEALTSNTGIWRWVLLEVVGLDEAMRVVDEAMRVVLSWEH